MRSVLVLILVTGTMFLFWTDANSCGDKFLVIGRGIRYERAYAAVHPASILVFTNDPKLTKDLESTLTKSGHKIQTVGDETALFTNLKTTKYDLVLVNLKDVAHLEAAVMATPSKPAVLPVIFNTTGTELDTAKKEYNCVLKYSSKNKNAVTVIDEVMEAKLKGKPLICKWTK